MWLSLSLSLHRRGDGWDLIMPEAKCHGKGCCIRRLSNASPATDSLDIGLEHATSHVALSTISIAQAIDIYVYSQSTPPHFSNYHLHKVN